MKIGPLFKWFGSKWQSAKRYPAPDGSRIIIEPFAGGAGYSLNHCDRDVVLYDTDPHLSDLWPWLITSATPELIREIPTGIPAGTDIRTLGLCKGQALLLKNWQRTNNVGDCWTTSSWGHLPGQWTANTRARVADEIGAVRHWNFAEPSGAVNIPYVTWFFDPPYEFNYRYWRGHKPFNYAALAAFVNRIDDTRSRIIVCESLGKKGEKPSWLPFKASHSSVTSRRKATQSHHSSELAWIAEPVL